MRYAIYFTPERDDPLAKTAARWLGRDPHTGEALPPVAVGSFSAAEIAFHTAAARRYGFHATLKAPFRLMDGLKEAELCDALDRYTLQQEPVHLERIKLARLDSFFALVPADPSPELNALASDIVTAFEPYRAPLSPSEIERRNPDNLSPAQLKNLHKWGYPYVHEEFRFHMTLTGRVPAAEAERMEQAISDHFGPLLLEPLTIGTLALFIEPEPGAPFKIKSLHPLQGGRARKTA